MKKYIFILTMLFCQIALAQEKGTIKGTLLDKEMNNEPLSFAGVLIKGTTIGTETDIDGNYILTVDPGSYTLVFSFLGYQQLELNVVVKSNEITTANAILEASKGLALEEVKLRAVTSKEKESALLIEQKKAVTIDQKIGSEELSRKGVSDVATALTKTTGISKQQGSGTIFFRGFGDRYNMTTFPFLPFPFQFP